MAVLVADRHVPEFVDVIPQALLEDDPMVIEDT